MNDEQQKNLDKPNSTPVIFKNFSKEDFTGKYDGQNYFFEAGAEMYVAAYLAAHFAKHLVDREVQKMLKKDREGKEIPRTVNDPIRKELEAKALPGGMKEPEPIPEEGVDLSSDVTNKNAELEKEKKEEESKETEKKPEDKPKEEKKEEDKPKLKGISELREIYEASHPEGKRPSPAWNAEQLQAKIDGFKAGKGDAEADFEGA